MSTRDQHRLRVLLDLQGDRMTSREAALALKISPRQLRTLRGRLRAEGASGLIHRGRGKRPVNACSPELAEQVLANWRTKYEGFNQVHFTSTLEFEEGILLSRSTIRRLLAKEGIGAPKPQKRSRHRRHRVRRAQEGAMIQMDGSPHDWLEGRGPRMTLVGGVDDATSRAWGTFDLSENTAGYFEVLYEIVDEFGIPFSLYLDRTTIGLGTRNTPERVRTETTHFETQLGRVMSRLGISLIQARSPQAKGRVERLWRTLQDRLVSELRAKQVRTLAGARTVLKAHLAQHNRLFQVAAIDPNPAWSPLPEGLHVADAICWTYKRVVANDNTVSVDGTRLQLQFPGDDPGWARRRVVVSRRLDNTWFVTFLGRSVPATPITTNPKAIAA